MKKKELGFNEKLPYLRRIIQYTKHFGLSFNKKTNTKIQLYYQSAPISKAHKDEKSMYVYYQGLFFQK